MTDADDKKKKNEDNDSDAAKNSDKNNKNNNSENANGGQLVPAEGNDYAELTPAPHFDPQSVYPTYLQEKASFLGLQVLLPPRCPLVPAGALSESVPAAVPAGARLRSSFLWIQA